jgi:DNA mismatch endonuclease (patch repair protein)
MDIFEADERSKIMSKVKSGDSKMEVKFRKALWRKGFRYVKNAKKYFGKPDLVLPKYKTVIFLDSCFWHKCPLHYKGPETNVDFWEKKIGKNWERDRLVDKHYKTLKWNLVRIWEHELNKRDSFCSKIATNIRKLRSL